MMMKIMIGGVDYCFLADNYKLPRPKRGLFKKKRTGVALLWRTFGSQGMLRIVCDGHQDLVKNLAFYEVEVKSENLSKKRASPSPNIKPFSFK